ncbi:MAG: ATP-binding cassette domain-containing protein [Stappiaceae bacterium]
MADPILEVEGIEKRFGGVLALDNVSLSVHPGEVVALAGDNGAGKSTLIKIISGVHSATAGTIRFKGEKVRFENSQRVRDAGIETIYQDLALADNLDVGANVFLGREPLMKRFGVLPAIDRAHMRREADKVLANLNIDIAAHKMSNPVRMLSGGQRQAVAIARAIYWNASLLIMDEPTAALGVPEQRKVVELIKSLKESNVAIIFISHNLADIFAVSDRIAVLRRGELAGERLISETNADEVVKLMVGG